MPKKRKTRKEKIRSETRQKESNLFSINAEWLKTGTKKEKTKIVLGEPEKKYFRLDLTKTFLLSMLVLA
ncbi:MAG TPA: hypothetical protein VLH94_01330, partial [Spirochaetia bacterium]|nr:hypothetical protein [Spirochaetia bacterium]